MKVCNVCNEIVSANQGCSRSDCPVQNGTIALTSPKVEPGRTGRTDKAVQTGLDFAGDTARRTTRQVVLAMTVAAFIGVAGFLAYRALWKPSSPWEYENIDLEVGPEGIATAIDSDKKAAIGIEDISYGSLGAHEKAELVSILMATEGEPGLGEVIVARRADCGPLNFTTLSLPSNEKLQVRRIDYTAQMTGFRFKLKPFETAAIQITNSGNAECSYFQIDRNLTEAEWGQDEAAAREGLGQVGAITRSKLGWTYSPEGLEERLMLADAGKGRDIFAKCASCHTVNRGGMDGIGPNLYGVIGRTIASKDGFAYSPALSAKAGAWDFSKLDRWLASPKAFAPGTKMSFYGLSSAKERADLIVYLNGQGSQKPLPTAPTN